MGAKRSAERDLRSLDRRGLRSIFQPLDPDEPPAAPSARGYRSMQMFTSAFTREEPRWRDGIGLLFMPILVVLISVLLWIGVPQVLGWLVVLGYVVLFTTAAVLAYRRT